MALVLPVVDSQDPQVDSSARGDADVQTGRIDDETDQKKLTGKELSKGKNKNFVPLVKSQTKKKAGEEPEADPEDEDTKKEAKSDRGSCGKKDSAKTKKADGCGCDHKKKKKDGGPYLTAGAMKKMDAKKGKGDPCWAGYEQAGMKMKGGKRVPNCIPKAGKKKDSYKKDAAWAEGFKFDGKCLYMESEKLAATDLDRAKRKKNAQGQPRNKIISGTRNT